MWLKGHHWGFLDMRLKIIFQDICSIWCRSRSRPNHLCPKFHHSVLTVSSIIILIVKNNLKFTQIWLRIKQKYDFQSISLSIFLHYSVLSAPADLCKKLKLNVFRLLDLSGVSLIYKIHVKIWNITHSNYMYLEYINLCLKLMLSSQKAMLYFRIRHIVGN
jgi:hypothetical protein